MTRKDYPIRHWLAVALALAALAASGCKTTPPDEAPKPPDAPTGPHAGLLKLLPGAQDISDWKPADKAQVYALMPDPVTGMEALEKDLGPAAAALKDYEYVKSATRKYTRAAASETVTLRVFEMKTPSEAFGIFSVITDGNQFPVVGTAARMGNTALGFVKGSYFGSVEYTGTGDAGQVLMDFGRWAADQITSPGYRPSILEMFPMNSLPGERYYLHTFSTLSSLPFVPVGDASTMSRMLSLGMNTDVAVMGYPTETPGSVNYLFLIRYPSEGDAQAAYAAYDGYLAGSRHPAEMNVAVAPPVGAYLSGTFNAEENSVRDQLARLLGSLRR